MKNKYWLIVIIFISLFLRLYNLGLSDLDNDEAKTALGVAFPHSFLLPDISVYSQKIFGWNETAAYLPFVFFGLLSVLLFYFIGKEIEDKKTGLALAFLASVIPGLVLFSRSAYLDMPMVASWIFIILFWFKYEKKPNLANSFILFIGLTVSPFLKIQGIYIYIILGLFLLITKKLAFVKDRRFWLIVLSIVPFFCYFLSQPQQLYDMRSFIKDTGFFSPLSFFQPFFQTYGFYIFFFIAGLFLSIKEIVQARKIKNYEVLAGIYLIFILLILFFTPKRAYYYPIISFPIIFFGAVFIKHLFERYQKTTLFLCFLMAGHAFLIISNPSQLSLLNSGRWWLDNKAEINREIEKYNPREIFFDDNLGFSGRWYINREMKKTENLENFLIENENTGIIIASTKKNYKRHTDKFTIAKDFGDLILLKSK